MTRKKTKTNLDELEKRIAEGNRLMIETLKSERADDVQHLREHLAAARNRLDWVAQFESHMIDAVRHAATQMRAETDACIDALKAHIEHFDEAEKLPAPAPRLKAVE